MSRILHALGGAATVSSLDRVGTGRHARHALLAAGVMLVTSIGLVAFLRSL